MSTTTSTLHALLSPFSNAKTLCGLLVTWKTNERWERLTTNGEAVANFRSDTTCPACVEILQGGV